MGLLTTQRPISWSHLRPPTYSFTQLTSHTEKVNFKEASISNCSKLSWLGFFLFLPFTVLNHKCLGNGYQNKCFWLASLIAKIAGPASGPHLGSLCAILSLCASFLHLQSDQMVYGHNRDNCWCNSTDWLPETSSRCLRGWRVARTRNHKMSPDSVPYNPLKNQNKNLI